MRLGLHTLAFLVAAASLGGRAHAELVAGSFVRVDGTRFVVDGKPFAFLGANLEAVQGGRNREQYRATVAALKHDALSVGRVWAFGEGPADASDWYRKDQLFRAGPDGYIEEAYQQLDRVLVAARSDGVRLIVTLSNNWSNYGGVPMYLRWAGLPVDEVDAFYRDDRVRARYRDGVEKLLARVNTISGVRYIDDPTIFSWELMNESTVPTPAAAEARRRWIVEMARFIKARDPNHLVAAGVAGYANRAERSEWIRVHRLAEVDYCDSHLYPQSGDHIDRFRRLDDQIDDRAQLAQHVIGKPLVIGEFGFHTAGSDGRRWLGLPRAALFARFVARLALDGVAGALVWIYQPWPDFARDFGIYIDRRDTDDVRAALIRAGAARQARPQTATNPRLRASWGERLLYDPLVTVLGPPGARHDRWRSGDGGERLLEIPPTEFTDARFENSGVWDQTALRHVYGGGSGRFRYRFTAATAERRAGREIPPSAIHIRARLSSEWPGQSGPPDGASPVEVLVDGVKVAALTAATDDGAGTVHEIALSDRALLARLAVGTHTLTFQVPDRPDAHGLCIYGAPTGIGRPPVGEALPIQIVYSP